MSQSHPPSQCFVHTDLVSKVLFNCQSYFLKRQLLQCMRMFSQPIGRKKTHWAYTPLGLHINQAFPVHLQDAPCLYLSRLKLKTPLVVLLFFSLFPTIAHLAKLKLAHKSLLNYYPNFFYFLELYIKSNIKKRAYRWSKIMWNGYIFQWRGKCHKLPIICSPTY